MPIPTAKPIVTIPVATPFDDSDHVDFEALGRNVDRWKATPLSGYIVGTASGEEWFLDETDKIRIAKQVADQLGDDGFVIGGIDCPGVVETLRRAEVFAEAGAQAVRVRIPRYEETVEAFYEQVLPRCPVPVLIMHQCNPERFGWAGQAAAQADVIGRLCSMTNVFGYVTDHDVRFEAQVRRLTAPDMNFWICNGSLILSGVLFGCNGTTTAFSNVWPSALHELLTLGMAGKFEEARALQDKVQRIDAVMLRYGAVGVKAAMKLLGFDGMRSPAPRQAMPQAEVERLESVMRQTGLLT